jgi:TRAP-type transport system small permease protein
MRKLYRWLCKAEEAACGVGFGFLIFFIFISAVLRLFKFSMSWYLDLAMLCLAWTSFLGADVAWRHGQILGIDLITRIFPKTAQRVIELAMLAVIMAALAVIFIFGIRLAWVDRLATYQSMPIPYSLVTYSLITASLSMFFTTIQKMRNVILIMAGKRPDPAAAQAAAANADATGGV